MEEQGFLNEFDETDQRAMHLVMYECGMPVATCRIFRNQGTQDYVIGCIAVRGDLSRLLM